MRIGGLGVIPFALLLAACGGEGEPSDAAPADQAQQASAVDPAEAPAAAPAPPPRSGGGRVAAAPVPVPTAADSAAAAREDVSPEWKMNQRSMAPYAECMAQASTTPESVRARLEAACRNRPDAPK